jgi:hypothetical protein
MTGVSRCGSPRSPVWSCHVQRSDALIMRSTA